MALVLIQHHLSFRYIIVIYTIVTIRFTTTISVTISLTTASTNNSHSNSGSFVEPLLTLIFLSLYTYIHVKDICVDLEIFYYFHIFTITATSATIITSTTASTITKSTVVSTVINLWDN